MFRVPRSAFRVPSAGFTLIELLVTLVILSTGIVVVLRAFETAMAALGESRDVLYGTLLAREKLAELQGSLKGGTPPSADASGWFEGDFTDYRWTFHAAQVAAAAPQADPEEEQVSLHEIELAVWRDGRDERQTIRTYWRY